MLIVKHEGKYYGPFLSYETASFASTLEGDAEVIPLRVPRLPEETRDRDPATIQVMRERKRRAHVDGFKVDTHHVLASIMQGFYFARRDDRVLTAREIREIWDLLYRVSAAVESLMHHADRVIVDPQRPNLDALRKAVWRNRDSDDVDPHYRDRFW